MIIETCIKNGNAINALARNYNTLDYSVKLTSLLNTIYPSENFDNFSKYELHKLLNETLFKNYNGEEILKYKLFECHLKKQNIVAAFEIKVNNSRVDFLTINGHTRSFEIKSELDNLSKLSKQMADYMLAFEYNYLVVDEIHIEKAKELLPKGYGLWSYKNGNYKKLQKSELNDKINPEVQLSLLTKKELINNFHHERGEVKTILAKNKIEVINAKFKKTLKDRYRKRWGFLLQNKEHILPIDLQFFFNRNIEPLNIYYH